MLAQLADSEGVHLEPSALAGMYGPVLLEKLPAFREYVKQEAPADVMAKSTQLVWATGGSMVPKEEMEGYYRKGREILSR